MPKRSQENASLPASKKIRLQDGIAAPAPAFQSLLKSDAIDFPRGGGTSLTPHEVKVSRAEAAQEAKEHANRQKSIHSRQKKNKQPSTPKSHTSSEALVRIEHLNYKRIVPGMTILGQIIAIREFHIIVALPNQVVGHVPVTNISEAYTKQLDINDDNDVEGNGDNEMKQDIAPLDEMFYPGQFLNCFVSTVHAAAQNEARIRDPLERYSKRVELSLYPGRINADIAVTDMLQGIPVMAAIRSVEDRGCVLDLGRSDLSGFLPHESKGADEPPTSLGRRSLGSVAFVTPSEKVKASGSRTYQMTLQVEKVSKALLKSISNVGSVAPGALVNVLVTSVAPTGLTVQFLGSFVGTVDLFHMTGEQHSKAKVGSKFHARVLYRLPATDSPKFVLSILPNIISLQPEMSPPEDIHIGDVVQGMKIAHVEQEWGALVEFEGHRGFVHISQLSDDHVVSLSGKSGPYREGTTHAGRLLLYNPYERLWQVTLKLSTIGRKYLNASDIPTGELVKVTVKKLTESALIVTTAEGFHAVVHPDHYADIPLRHPEKRFKPGSTVSCRVLVADPLNHKLTLTAKKTLVESSLPIVTSFSDAKIGLTTHGYVRKVLDNGLLIGFYNGLKGFLPKSEMSLSDQATFQVGKPLTVTIIRSDPQASRLIVSLRAEPFDMDALEAIELGDTVQGAVREIHSEQVVLILQPTRVRALLSLDGLANRRNATLDALRATLSPGETVQDLTVTSKNLDKGLVIVKFGQPKAASQKRSLTFESLIIGQEVVGKLIGSTRKGSLVRISPTVTAILHVTDVWDNFDDGSPFPDIGTTVKGRVVALDQATKQPLISTRPSRMGASKIGPSVVDPEIEAIGELVPSQPVRGYVKSITEHGLFVTVGRELDARVQIKELFDEYIKDWQSRFKQGQVVSGRILSADLESGKIEMSLKSHTGRRTGHNSQIDEYRPGQTIDGTVRKIEKYGIFLEIAGTQVSGLCHKSEISDRKDMDELSILKAFKEGDRVKAKVISVDLDKGRISFGLKPSYFQEDSVTEDEHPDSDQASEFSEQIDEDPSDPAFMGDTRSSPEIVHEPSTDVQRLRISDGFEWNPLDKETESEGGSMPLDTVAEIGKRTKQKNKQVIELDNTASLHKGAPESTVDFERLLLGSPNSSYLWIRYMSHLLQLSELEKAREVAQTALQTIHFREEQEKYNVWIAMLNMENTYGTDETLEKTLHNASRANDSKTIHLRLASIFQQSGKTEKAEALYQTIVKKFSSSSKAWVQFGAFLLSTGKKEQARALLPRALKSLEERKHIKTIIQFAQLEYREGDEERGRTIMEGVIDSHPKRTDLWSVYVDMEVGQRNLDRARGIFSRTLSTGLTKHKAKTLFKKWLDIEQKHGSEAEIEAVKERALEWTRRYNNVES